MYKEIAAKLGFDESYVRNFVEGSNEVSNLVAEQIKEAYQLPPDAGFVGGPRIQDLLVERGIISAEEADFLKE
jgi:hypothetical protein